MTSSGTDSNITFFIFCSFVLIEGHDLLRNFRCKIFALDSLKFTVVHQLCVVLQFFCFLEGLKCLKHLLGKVYVDAVFRHAICFLSEPAAWCPEEQSSEINLAAVFFFFLDKRNSAKILKKRRKTGEILR